MGMMVQNMISKEETNKLQEVFKCLDINGDGKLQYDELLSGYEQFHGDLAKEEVDRIFKLVDSDKTGEISFSEFLTATVNKCSLLQEEKLRVAFEMFDKDKSGNIDIDEIKSVLGVGKNISEEIWHQVISEVDTNGDGAVQFDEF